jgi:acyl carrier protein
MANNSPDSVIDTNTTQKVIERIIELVRENFPSAAANVSGAKSLTELGLDSLDIVDLMWTIESDFSIKFNNEELQKITSLDLMAALIISKQRT